MIGLILKYANVFGFKEDPVTVKKLYKQTLHLTDDIPVYTKQYRTPHAHKPEIRRQVNEMLKNGIIQPSTSYYNNPIIVVPKKSVDGDKKWRLVVDLRNLNKKLITDKYPLPRIEDI